MRLMTVAMMLFAVLSFFSLDLMGQRCKDCDLQYNICMGELRGKKKCTHLKNKCLRRCTHNERNSYSKPRPVYRPQPKPTPPSDGKCKDCDLQYNICMGQMRGKAKCQRRLNNCKQRCHHTNHYVEPKPRPTYTNCDRCHTKFNICMGELRGRAECNRMLRNCNPQCFHTVNYDPAHCIRSCQRAEQRRRADCLYTFEQTPCPRVGKERTRCIQRLENERSACYMRASKKDCRYECTR